MKGIVLAGGLGTRLYPITKITNKHLLPVYSKPMVFYPIWTLVDAGVTEVLVVTGGNNAGDFLRVLRNGEEFGLKQLSYRYQEGEGGIAAALSLAEHVLTACSSRGKPARATARGSLLLTHFGLSGPVALDISRYITLLPDQRATLVCDFLPGQSPSQAARLSRAAARAEARLLERGVQRAVMVVGHGRFSHRCRWPIVR